MAVTAPNLSIREDARSENPNQSTVSLCVSAGGFNESLLMEERVYMRWDNINYYVPAKKSEVRVFEEWEN